MKKIIAFLILITAVSCKNGQENYDASGTFEADEVMVSAEANGSILELKLEEGQNLTADQKVGMIDGKVIELQKEQVLASINAIDERTNSSAPQVEVYQSQLATQKANISVLQTQLQTAERERNRTANLVRADAATRKQLDDANSQVAVIQKQISVANAQLANINQQIASARQQVDIQNRAVLSEKKPTQTKVAQIDEQLQHNIITSPISGTVLTKYMNKGEFATAGKPIFKMADLSTMILRVYLTGDQLPKVKTGENVKVYMDAGDGKMRETTGTLEWISPVSEFTPKTIQTKDERANLVYAAKVRVKNDGFIKIGMYGEIKI